MRFDAPIWLFGAWVIPVGVLLLAVSMSFRGASRRRLYDRSMLGRMTLSVSTARPVLKGLAIILGAASVSVALARPQWNAEPEQIRRTGRDVCFVIDVSRSMLAEDLAPNRLQRTKLWVRDALGSVEGDRIALVAFAGTAVVKSPLTHDEGFFRLALEELGPDSVARGGTLIGDAIRLAMNEVFELGASAQESDSGDEAARYRDIILITDGEDHESFPVEAAAAAGERGVRIIVIGIGDETTGMPIPITDERGRRTYITYKGERVLTRLDAEMLQRVAQASRDGRYLNVATGTINLDTVYRQFIREQSGRAMEETSEVRFQEKFQVFIGIALTLLLFETFIRERRRV